MIDEVVPTEDDVHVYPLFGKPHKVGFEPCWCHPERDTEVPEVIIHNVEN